MRNIWIRRAPVPYAGASAYDAGLDGPEHTSTVKMERRLHQERFDGNRPKQTRRFSVQRALRRFMRNVDIFGPQGGLLMVAQQNPALELRP